MPESKAGGAVGEAPSRSGGEYTAGAESPPPPGCPKSAAAFPLAPRRVARLPYNGEVSRLRGTVTKIVGTSSAVATELGSFQCDLRAKIFRKRGRRLAVGDRVEVQPVDASGQPVEAQAAIDEAGEGGEPRGMIEAIEERRTALRRVRDFKRDQVLVANVDRVFLVVAVLDPPYKRAFLDRLVVACERDELEPFLVFNKVDLAGGDYLELVGEDAAVYEALGYPTLLVSAETGQGVPELAAAFEGRISVVVGPSGVGKSTLLNAVRPGLRLRTGEVSEHDGRGRHTTTAAELIALPRREGSAGGGFVVDTPGLRGFGLWDLEPREIMQGFREIAAAAAGCRFRDCLHRTEPGCAVRAAVEGGEVDEERYFSYLRLVDEATADATSRQTSRRR